MHEAPSAAVESAKKLLKSIAREAKPVVKQTRVAVIDTRCKNCDGFTLHSVTRVTCSQFGRDQHHVLTCQECGNERRLETITEEPSTQCWNCREAAVEGEVLCATCKLLNMKVRAR